MTLTSEELEIIQKTSFDVPVLEILKRETEMPIFLSQNYSDIGEADGYSDSAVVSEIKHTKKTIAIRNLRNLLIGLGYYPYISEENNKRSPDKITVLKTEDQFDVLRFRKTNGVNHGIYTSDIIEKLSKWNAEYGLDIIGADFDWVSFEMHHLPEDMEVFGQELYEFCPDIIDQGFESMEQLISAVSYWNFIQLWWD